MKTLPEYHGQCVHRQQTPMIGLLRSMRTDHQQILYRLTFMLKSTGCMETLYTVIVKSNVDDLQFVKLLKPAAQ